MGVRGREPRRQIWEREAERGREKEDKEDTKTYEARTTDMRQKRKSPIICNRNC